ncbi:MAG: hypothetical protein BWX63_02240 [Bacteroidetes bacterium ADurb.Bin041]|jgi:hypothetical protein|nr:MAG: hypothetical protein BWX63_02240 [Bacteroidetes bacterium ADurb.Bin041]
MLMAEALIECANGVKEILQSSGLIEGETLESLDGVDTVVFWHSLAKNGGGNKDTYIVWNVFPNTPLVRADDSSKRWRSSALIEIYTRFSLTYLSIQQLLKRINQEAINSGWDVSLFEVPSYEPELKRTRYTLQVSKII